MSHPNAKYEKILSKQLINKIDHPRNVGFFTSEGALEKQLRLVIGSEGDLTQGERISLFVLVDENDGIIADAKFQVFGPPTLLAALEIVCDLIVRKNYDQARRITVEQIDAQVRAKKETHAFPNTALPHLHLVLLAIDHVANQCMDIPILDGYITSPLPQDSIEKGDYLPYPGWEELSVSQKKNVLEELLTKEIRPYIELDAGGVQIINIVNHYEIIIAYEGNCVSCYSATGSTLSAIQQILRAKIHPHLIVTPDLKNFTSAALTSPYLG